MSDSDTPDDLLKQDSADDVDAGHLCVKRLSVVLRDSTLSDIFSSSPAIKQAACD